MSSLLASARPRLTRLLRRRRRPLAAVLAATAVLLALSSLRSTPAQPTAIDPRPSALRAGEVAMPIVLPSAALARTLAVGDVIDVLGVHESDSGQPQATVAASSARVVELPEAGSGFGATTAAVVLLAVRETDALTLGAAAASGPLTVVIRRR